MSGDVIRYSYRHAPTLWKFAQSDAFIRGLMGCFRSGKSSACSVEILRRAQMQAPGKDGIRRTRWMVIRNSSRDLRDTTIKTFMMWAPESRFGTFNRTNLDYTITGIPGCHIEVMFRGLDREEDVKKLLSLEITGAWVNEAREIPWGIINALQGRVRQYPSKEMGGCTWGGIWMDTNPPDNESKWYDFFEVQNLPAAYREIFKQPSGLSDEAENLPYINGGRGYYEQLAIGKDTDYIKVYVHGQYGFTKYGKVVYDEYNDALHCIGVNPVPGIPIHRGYDWGLSPSCVFSQLMPDQRWLVFDEIVSDDMSIEDFMEDVKDYSQRSFAKLPEFIDTGDPAGEIRSEIDKRSCFSIATAKGFNVSPGIQSPLVRIESVRKPLRRLIGGKPQFILHPRCKSLRKGFMGGYHYRKKKTVEQYEPKPYKNQFSHCFVAGTPVSTPMGSIAIDKLRRGDLVCTPLGLRRVTAVMSREAAALHEIVAGAASIVCTPEHLFATDDGFVRADALRYGDRLYEEVSSWAAQQSTPSKSSMGGGTIARPESTSNRTTPAAAPICTEMCGNSITARSRIGTMSITATVIAPTIKSAISNLCRRLIIPGITVLNGIAAIRRDRRLTWLRSGLWLLLGTDRVRAAPGIDGTPEKSPDRCNARNGIAQYVERNSMARSGFLSWVFADLAASRRLAEPAESITKSDVVPFAPELSLSIATLRRERVASSAPRFLERDQSQMVYDITVEDAHCFFAAGILVHNCHDALQYTATRIFGAQVLTGMDPMAHIYAEEAIDDSSRSSVTGY